MTEIIDGKLAFLEYIDSLPLSANRYLAAVKYLEDKVALKQSSQSVEIAFWVMIGAQVLMVFQAVWVLVLRISAKNFSLGSITRNNVIKPHPGNCFAIICILAFPFTMYCSIFQLGIRSLKTLDGYPIVVAFPCSFFWLSAWLFFWSWYGTVICNRWDPPWTQLSTIHTGRVPLWVIISLNLSIILGSLGCLGGYFGTATVLDRKMRKATKFVHQVIEQFLAESPKYDTAKWQESQFVQMMLLLIPIEHSFLDVLMSFKKSLIFNMVAILVLIATYPILIFTIASQKLFHKKTIRSFEKEHIRVAKIDYNKEMNCLLLASVALWIAILLYSPAVIYEYIKTAANPQSVTQIPRAVSLSLLGILAVFSNLILLATLSQTYRLKNNNNNGGFLKARENI